MGTPFCCIQLSGVRLMGSKVLKNINEKFLVPLSNLHCTSGTQCALEEELWPCIPNLSSTSYIEITSDIEFIQGLVPKREWGDQAHTILQEKKCKRYQTRYRVWYRIWYHIQISDIWYDIGYDISKKKNHINKNALQIVGNRTPAYRLTRGCIYRSATVAVNIMRKIIYIYNTCYDVIMKFQKLPDKDITNKQNTREKL